MKTMYEYIFEESRKALLMLNSAGYEAYFVGGYVRDFLMGKGYSYDIDITTNALPDDIKRIFSSMRTVDTGIAHGTVKVIVKFPAADIIKGKDDVCLNSPYGAEHGLSMEITTYRRDGRYSDNRHPDSVNFVSSLEEDLGRRDFTMNAIACDAEGSIKDPFGGRQDMDNRMIRAVGEPEKRFEEDGLRILRALRFSAVLGFSVEPKTAQAIFDCKAFLRNISPERSFSEFKKLVCGKNAGEVIRKYTDVLGEIVPELCAMKGFNQRNEYHKYDVLEHCVRAMEAVNTTAENVEYMKLAALFHDVGKPETFSADDSGTGHFYGHPSAGERIVLEILSRFKADGFTSERVSKLIKYHDIIFEKNRGLLKKWMNRFTPQVLLEILEIKKADNFATGSMSDELRCKFDDIEKMIKQILKENQCFSLKDLAVTGSDLIKAGMKPGPEMGILLQYLLEKVIDDEIPNEKKQLLDEATDFIV